MKAFRAKESVPILGIVEGEVLYEETTRYNSLQDTIKSGFGITQQIEDISEIFEEIENPPINSLIVKGQDILIGGNFKKNNIRLVRTHHLNPEWADEYVLSINNLTIVVEHNVFDSIVEHIKENSSAKIDTKVLKEKINVLSNEAHTTLNNLSEEGKLSKEASIALCTKINTLNDVLNFVHTL